MSQRTRLLRAHVELTAAIIATEKWEASYTKSPTTFKRLVRGEAELQASATEYLLDLRSRLPDMVSWYETGLSPVQASAVPPGSNPVWEEERRLLMAALASHVLNLMVIGGNAGEDIYGVPLGITTLDEAFITAADRYTAGLVSQVTDTTRRNIQKAIKQSIAQGEDVRSAINRVQDLVASPVRAELIARTESVNAYQSGLHLFGTQTGAKSSTWDALINACRLCSPLDGKTVALGEDFILANGTPVKWPPGHTRCRCGTYLNY